MGYSLNYNENRTRRRADPEQQLQELFVSWLWQNGILHCAIPGGMKTDMRTAMKMKRAGYRKGFPDVIIPMPTKVYHGLFMEVKYRQYPSEEQKMWRAALMQQGYHVVIMPANLSFQDALVFCKDQVRKYFGVRFL